MRRGKTALLLLACSICTAVLMALWPPPYALEVETAVIGSGELVQSLLLSGTVQYADQQGCVSLKNGIVRQVHVTAGQPVQRGELLFLMDTSAEEQALASLHAQKYARQAALAGVDDAAAVLAAQSQLDAAASEAQLLAAIEASRIRASADGIVQAVYVQPGDRVAETALLGVVRGEQLEVAAAVSGGEAGNILPGTAALGTFGRMKDIPLVLKQSTPQTLLFQSLGSVDWKAGDQVQLELMTGVQPLCALIPLSAISLDEKVWYIEEGRAHSAVLQIEQYNRSYASAPLDWAGKTVILYPEKHELAEGMAVKGAEAP